MAVTAGWNFNQSKNEVTLSDLALANVEALANTEDRDDLCLPMNTVWCSFVVATPNGNRIEDYPDYVERP